MFEKCGEVAQIKLLAREDGKSRGLAFIKFASKSAYEKALEFNGADFMGRSLRV